jgi:primase-polymerase (primpol)-like protein
MVTKPHTYNGDLASLPKALAPLTRLMGDAKDGATRWTKVPFNPAYFMQKARSNIPATWGSCDAVVENVTAKRADGIGLQLLNFGLAALDLDHCVDPLTWQIATWALALVNEAVEADAYGEKTVSGTGLRPWPGQWRWAQNPSEIHD